MKMKFDPNQPLTLFARLQGPKCIREFRALIDTGSDLCIIPIEDARDLGMNNYMDPSNCDGTQFTRISTNCYFEAESVFLNKIIIGDIEAQNVECLTVNLPKEVGIDVILGRSFLNNFKVTIDYKSGILSIE